MHLNVFSACSLFFACCMMEAPTSVLLDSPIVAATGDNEGEQYDLYKGARVTKVIMCELFSIEFEAMSCKPPSLLISSSVRHKPRR